MFESTNLVDGRFRIPCFQLTMCTNVSCMYVMFIVMYDITNDNNALLIVYILLPQSSSLVFAC